MRTGWPWSRSSTAVNTGLRYFNSPQEIPYLSLLGTHLPVPLTFSTVYSSKAFKNHTKEAITTRKHFQVPQQEIPKTPTDPG